MIPILFASLIIRVFPVISLVILICFSWVIFKHCGILLAHWIERFIEMEDKWWTFWELNRLADDWKRKLWHSFTATASSRRSLRLNRWRDELFPKIYDGLLAYNAVVISAPKSHAWNLWKTGKDDLSIMELCMLWIWIVDTHTVGQKSENKSFNKLLYW